MADGPGEVVIVGAGQAGASLAASLRERGHEGGITLVGEEPDAPYQRPPLSKKYLLGEMSADRLALRPESFWEERGIRLLTGTRVTAIDRERRRVVLDGEELAWDALALATGAVPRRLPDAIGGALPGVHVLRWRADADRLAPEMAEASRVLIVGGGYIGLEAAAVCAQKGLSTTLVELSDRILNRVACAETAAFLRDLHRAHGVDLREATGLERLEGGGRVERAVLSDGSVLPVDLVIVGIGILPDTRLAEAAGLVLDNGIAVDGRSRSSDPAIFAAGDCASFPWEGGRIRLESVQNAIDQGEHAAGGMLGETADYRPLPWFWSDQYDAKLQIAGLGIGHDRIVERPGHRPGGRSFWYFRRGRLIAVDAVSDPKAYMQGKRWLAEGRSPAPDALSDPDRPLTDLAPAAG